MRNVFRTPILVAAAALLGACTQFTTSDSEERNLRSAADIASDNYLACVKREALLYVDSSQDASFVSEAAQSRCESDLNTFAEAEKAYQGTQVMLTDKPVAAAVDQLRATGRTVVANEMLREPARRADASAPVAAPAARPAATAPGNVSIAPAAGATTSWAPEQRVYLDCMLEQANRYGGLNESAETIAEVAQNRCSSYLGGANASALVQEGRALVLGTVLDAKLNPRKR